MLVVAKSKEELFKSQGVIPTRKGALTKATYGKNGLQLLGLTTYRDDQCKAGIF